MCHQEDIYLDQTPERSQPRSQQTGPFSPSPDDAAQMAPPPPSRTSPPNPNNQCITGTTNVANVTIVTTDENRPKLSAEESLPDPSSGSVQQRHWRVMLDQIAEDDLEGLEVFLETFVGFASTSQGETASNVPQNGPHRSRNIPGRQRHPRPSRPEYDPIEAARVQKLYRTNRRKCMNHILKGKSPPCPLDGGTIINHLRSPAGGAPMEDAHLS